MVTVASFPDLPEAELAKERLMNEGIEAFVLHGGSAGVLPTIATSGGVQVQVVNHHETRAREILEG